MRTYLHEHILSAERVTSIDPPSDEGTQSRHVLNRVQEGDQRGPRVQATAGTAKRWRAGVLMPKGGKQRTEVTLPSGRPGGVPHTAAVLFSNCGALNRNDVNRIWRTARAAAAITGSRASGMHMLRHTAASAWLAAGVDIRTVAAVPGAERPGFTPRTYTHVMPDAADRARRAMDTFFRGESALVVPSEGSG
jgi:integrase